MDNYLSPEQKNLKKKADSMKIVLDCPLCDQHGLHVIGSGQIETRQCLNCGYATSPKYIGERASNEMYATLPDDMKKWSVEADGKIWIPAIITLPFGMLYPENIDNMVDHQVDLRWSFAEMVGITEEEKKDYEIEGQPGKYYTQRYDTDNSMKFDMFIKGFSHLNEKAKEESEKLKAQMPGQEWPQEKVKDIKLPKLKKQ